MLIHHLELCLTQRANLIQAHDVLKIVFRTVNFSLVKAHLSLGEGIKGCGEGILDYLCYPPFEVARLQPSLGSEQRQVDGDFPVSSFELKLATLDFLRGFYGAVLLEKRLEHGEKLLKRLRNAHGWLFHLLLTAFWCANHALQVKSPVFHCLSVI